MQNDRPLQPRGLDTVLCHLCTFASPGHSLLLGLVAVAKALSHVS